MLQNLNLMKGLVFSGQLLLDLTQKGASREQAYVWVQRNAMRVWKNEGDFKNLVMADEDISKYLSQAEIDRAFELPHQLRHVDTIYRRVYND
jgi:adenylosuccinate lyase